MIYGRFDGWIFWVRIVFFLGLGVPITSATTLLVVLGVVGGGGEVTKESRVVCFSGVFKTEEVTLTFGLFKRAAEMGLLDFFSNC